MNSSSNFSEKIVYVSFGIICLLAFSWEGYLFLSLPDLAKIETEINTTSNQSLVNDKLSIRPNKEIYQKNQFLENEVIYCEIFCNSLPHYKRQIDSTKTNVILQILNDASSYGFEENNTDNCDLTILYFNKEHNIVGYTKYSYEGEVSSLSNAYSFNGVLSNNGLRRMMAALK